MVVRLVDVVLPVAACVVSFGCSSCPEVSPVDWYQVRSASRLCPLLSYCFSHARSTMCYSQSCAVSVQEQSTWGGARSVFALNDGSATVNKSGHERPVRDSVQWQLYA